MYYPEELKLEIVELIIKKKLTQAEARRKYSIKGHSTIAKWLRKYGNLPYINNKKRRITMKEQNQKENYNERIRKLEKLLADKELELDDYKLKAAFYEKLIDLAEEDYKIKIKKTLGQRNKIIKR